jgi:hypothetical protein
VCVYRHYVQEKLLLFLQKKLNFNRLRRRWVVGRWPRPIASYSGGGVDLLSLECGCNGRRTRLIGDGQWLLLLLSDGPFPSL